MLKHQIGAAPGSFFIKEFIKPKYVSKKAVKRAYQAMAFMNKGEVFLPMDKSNFLFIMQITRKNDCTEFNYFEGAMAVWRFF